MCTIKGTWHNFNTVLTENQPKSVSGHNNNNNNNKKAKQEFEEINNYSELRVEITRIWNMETEVAPVVIGTPFQRICIATLKDSGLKCMSQCCRSQHCLAKLISCERFSLSEVIDLMERTIYDKNSSTNVYCEK